jgi:hypothetical protein
VECEKIQPCPYCGEREMHVHKTDHAFGEKIEDVYHVTCCGCAAFGPLHEKLKIAVKLWNFVSDAWYDNLSEDPAISQTRQTKITRRRERNKFDGGVLDGENSHPGMKRR